MKGTANAARVKHAVLDLTVIYLGVKHSETEERMATRAEYLASKRLERSLATLRYLTGLRSCHIKVGQIRERVYDVSMIADGVPLPTNDQLSTLPFLNNLRSLRLEQEGDQFWFDGLGLFIRWLPSLPYLETLDLCDFELLPISPLLSLKTIKYENDNDHEGDLEVIRQLRPERALSQLITSSPLSTAFHLSLHQSHGTHIEDLDTLLATFNTLEELHID